MDVHRFVAAAALLLALAPGLGAQARLTGADVEGSVTDPSGAVLPGVALTATNLDTNLARTHVSGADGHVVIPALAPGTYRITAELTGFRTQTAGGTTATSG